MNFLTGELCPSRSKQQIINKLDTVIVKCQVRGFSIASLHDDNEFNIKEINEHLQPINVHVHRKNDHMGVIKRAIRVIK